MGASSKLLAGAAMSFGLQGGEGGLGVVSWIHHKGLQGFFFVFFQY